MVDKFKARMGFEQACTPMFDLAAFYAFPKVKSHDYNTLNHDYKTLNIHLWRFAKAASLDRRWDPMLTFVNKTFQSSELIASVNNC